MHAILNSTELTREIDSHSYGSSATNANQPLVISLTPHCKPSLGSDAFPIHLHYYTQNNVCKKQSY